MAISDDYTSSTALTSYYRSRSERAPARLWSTDKLVQDAAEIGMIDVFEGPGIDPTNLIGYDRNKLWFRQGAGVQSASGSLRVWNGSVPESDIKNWPLLTPALYNQRIIDSLGGLDSLSDLASFYPDGGTARTLRSKLRDLINVRDYGAVGDGVTDDTLAIQNALNVALSRAGSSMGGGTVYIPPGSYKITDTLVINKSFVNLVGEGFQASYLKFANGAKDCISIDGAGAPGNNIRDISVVGLSIWGEAKTGGAAIKLYRTYRTKFERMSIENCITGFDIGVSANFTTIRDAVIVPNAAASAYGIYWHCPVDGSGRSDVLALHNVVIDCQYSNATCIAWEGFCQTMTATHLRLLRGYYGLRIYNVTPSGSYYPEFLNAFGFEAEGFKKRAVSIEAGSTFKFVGADITNNTGATNQGSADDHAVYVADDSSGSHVRSVQISDSRIGICNRSAISINSWDSQLSNIICLDTSREGSGVNPAVVVGANCRDIQIQNLRGEQYGGHGYPSYALQISSGAQGIQATNIDGTYCVNQAVNNLSSSETISIIGIVEPGNNASSLVTPGSTGANYRFLRSTDGSLNVEAYNRSTANNSLAAFRMITGLSNSYVNMYVTNGSGSPYFQASVGSGIASMNWTAPIHIWRVGNSTAFSIGQALPNYASDSAAASGGVPLYGYYRNGSVVQQRVA